MNVAYWFLLAPVVALDGLGWVDMAEVQRWLPYVIVFSFRFVNFIFRG